MMDNSRMENKIANHISEKVLISRIYRECLQIQTTQL